LRWVWRSGFSGLAQNLCLSRILEERKLPIFDEIGRTNEVSVEDNPALVLRFRWLGATMVNTVLQTYRFCPAQQACRQRRIAWERAAAV
jgi:hypothetical protein